MLDATSSTSAHRLRDIALVYLSIVFLPLDVFVLTACYVYNLIFQSKTCQKRDECRSRSGFVPRRVLVTGVGMTKGLALARLFYEAGHDVTGADFEPSGALACGRFSNSISNFYRLQKPSARAGSAPYIRSLIDIVSKEKVELWVSCSGVASATEDGEAKEIIEARTSCKAIQFDVNSTSMLHEKDSFIAHTKAIGLPVPETHRITRRAEVERVLRGSPVGRQYILKTIGVVDAVRADMTLLPKATQEETSRHIARLPVSDDIPWIIQQYISGSEYCTHSLIVNGRVKAFVACPSAELLMHYEALPADSVLSQAMQHFTQRYATAEGQTFTGHLSFDFMVEESSMNAVKSSDVLLHPIECNPRAHTAVALFNHTTSMADAYLSLLDPHQQDCAVSTPITPLWRDKYYWIGHDLVEKLILPTTNLIMLKSSLSEAIKHYKQFLVHFLIWKDGTFEASDPLPWWWLYHVYWPTRFITCAWQGRKWSRINVSTTKMFEC